MQDPDAKGMAMFRFGLIAPVINGTFSEPSKMAYYRNVAASELTLPSGVKVDYSPSTLSYWEGLYRKGGFDALATHARSDKGVSRKLAPDVTDAIVALRHKFPKINATMIYERLVSEGVVLKSEVSLSTVQRFLRGRAADPGVAAPTRDRKAFEAERVLALLQADSLYGPYVGSGKDKARAYLIAIIDDKSRLLVCGRFFLSDSALNFQRVFKDAVLRFGLPEKLYVDNGAPYKNDQLSAICGRLGVVLIHAPVRDGAAKGKIERLNRTIRTRFLSVLDPAQTISLEALNSAFAAWSNSYNTKEHTATAKTPMEAYRAEADVVRVPESAEWVAQSFMNRITRTVRADATVTIERVSYDVPICFIGTKVEILFSPDDMAGACIVCEGKTYPVRPTDKVVNFKAKRNNPYPIDYSNKGGKSDVSPAL
jgi:transposase InsO family protein